MARGLVYGGLRLGMYTPIKSAMGGDQKNDAWSFYKKVAAGMTSGGFAAAATNPTELVRAPCGQQVLSAGPQRTEWAPTVMSVSHSTSMQGAPPKAVSGLRHRGNLEHRRASGCST